MGQSRNSDCIFYFYNDFIIHFYWISDPSDPGSALVFQNALLLIIIGVALLEKYYTKPADLMVNSLMGMITLIGVYNIAPRLLWWIIAGYTLLVFLLSIITTSVYSLEAKDFRWTKLADFTYKPAVLFGQAKILYSVLFLLRFLPLRVFNQRKLLY